jgi:hypothetical protein
MTFDLKEDREGNKWNFLRSQDRARAREMILRERPMFVVGSPPCTAYCAFNERFNYREMAPQVVRRKRAEASVLLAFAMEIYGDQLKNGRHFLHEHPATASSWGEPRMRALRQRRGVGEVTAHMCQFGMRTRSGRAKCSSNEADSIPQLITRGVAETRAEMH